MKTELQAKFLQHLNRKKQDQGFTLIELLVVIIIIGILSAIALPSFLNQANKAKESEAKQYVGSTNRAQQAFYLEKSTFTTEWGRLGLGIATNTVNYKYTIEEANDDQTIIFGDKQKGALRSYVGGVQIGKIAGTGESTTKAILCQSKGPAQADANALNLTPNTETDPTCAGTWENLGDS